MSSSIQVGPIALSTIRDSALKLAKETESIDVLCRSYAVPILILKSNTDLLKLIADAATDSKTVQEFEGKIKQFYRSPYVDHDIIRAYESWLQTGQMHVTSIADLSSWKSALISRRQEEQAKLDLEASKRRKLENERREQEQQQRAPLTEDERALLRKVLLK